MIKNIKKSLKYFIIITGVILMVPGVLYLMVQNPEVQTYLVKRITRHFSAEIKSTISVGEIEFMFFNRLVINDLLIKDKNNDTLLFTEKITSGIKRIDIRNRSFRLGRVIIYRPVVAFITDTTGLMNLNWYLDIIRNPSDSTNSTKLNFSIDQIDISDARFSLVNHTGPPGKAKIKFNNLNLTGINGIIEDLKILNDTAKFNIYNLGFKESSGLSVSRMSSSVLLAKQNIVFNSTNLNCNSSEISIASFSLQADSSTSYKNFTEEVNLDLVLYKSLINTSYLQYFVPKLEGLDEAAMISGRIYGTIAELRGRNIELTFRESTYLDCDFDFSGLPDIDNTYMYIGVNSLRTTAEDIGEITLADHGNINVPEVLYKLGIVSFDGNFTGFTTDFVTYGMFRTNLGNIQTDISFRPEETDRYRIRGMLTGSNVNLGELTGKAELLGKLSVKTNIDGYAHSFKKFAANLTGKIDSIEVNKYIYRNIDLNGFFTENTWDGSVKIIDDNIKMDVLGMFNFSEVLPEFDFTLNLSGSNLYNLNFDKADTTSSLTMLLTSNFKGNSIDNLDGEIRLVNSSLIKYGDTLELNDFAITTYKDDEQPVLSLRTDFVDADIKGYYYFAAIGDLIQSTLSTLMPSQYEMPPENDELLKNNFNFEVNFKNTDSINNFFKTGILLAENSYVNGAIYTDSTIKFEGKADFLNIRNNLFRGFAVDANVTGTELKVDLNSSSLTLLGQSEQKGFSVDLQTKPDNFIFKLEWDNKDKDMNRGNFVARGTVAKDPGEEGNAKLTIEIDSTLVYSHNNLWKIDHSTISIDTTSIKVDKLNISNNNNYYMVNGTVSEDPSDTLYLDFKGIDISPLNLLISQKKVNDPDMISLNLRGRLNGKILLSNVYKDLLLESNIFVTDFSLLNSEFGTISIVSDLDITKKVLNINASNNLDGIKMLDISGFYYPELRKADILAHVSKLPIDALNSLLRVFASDISGSASGKVIFSAEPGNFVLNGSLMAENASLKIDYLQTSYSLNDSIVFDRDGIKFEDVKLADENGSIAILSGSVYHKNFNDFKADLVINISSPNECLVLNTKAKDNQLFYGTAYASGLTTIKSGPNSISFDISAKTGRNTSVFIPMNSGLSVSEYSFINFIDPNTGDDDENGNDKGKLTPATLNQTVMDLNFDLEVTPDAEVQLIFDSKVGDVMKGRGAGKLNINLDQKGNLEISGDYIIEEGDYLFTLGNIFNKSFSIENGGKIMFNGDLDNAEIELKATYKNLKTSLFPILQDERFNERISVEPQLNLSGRLFNPIVGFEINLPYADKETTAYLQNAISTEDELSRQVFSLLVMNSFIPIGSASGSPSTTGTSAMAATTFEMVSNQLSNWLSQISNDFDIGFNYRPGTKDINSQEVEVALSTQLLNDKVVLNSNFDVGGTGNTSRNTNQITGDFDAEIKITEKIRFKVFNRYNNPYNGKLAPYTQGIGIFFKQDFNDFSDLFRWKVSSEIKKEEEVRVEEKQ